MDMVHASIAPDERRKLSTSLFGAQYRLEICGSLQSGEQVTAAQLGARLGTDISKSSLSVELRRLREAGLLVPTNGTRSSRLVYLQVRDSPLWDTARQLIRDLTEKGAAK
jgi:hypothetical protein